MLGQSKSCYQAEIDAACELIDFWRFNVVFARRILADQPVSPPTPWNRMDQPAAGRVRPGHHPVQLHLDRGQPADGPRDHGQHRGVEAEPDPAARGALHDGPARGRRACHRGWSTWSPVQGQVVSEVAVPHESLAGIHFTGSTAGVPDVVAHGRGARGVLSRLPAPGRRDRGQGFRARPSQRRSGRRAGRPRPRGVRVPGRRSARRRRAPICRDRCGTADWASDSSPRRRPSATATSPTSPTSAAR